MKEKIPVEAVVFGRFFSRRLRDTSIGIDGLDGLESMKYTMAIEVS